MAKLPNNLKLVSTIGICLAAGALGSVFTTPAIGSWYSTLVKPSFNPPNWLFAPVWTSLYILMGIAWYLVWKKPGKKSILANRIFLFQLGLNVLWSYLFFGLHQPLWAVIEIVVLWLAIAATIKTFAYVSKPAAYLLLPYLVWVTFASFLNLNIVLLN
ncbi:MAG: TspO/MBR family protein [bacterium]|nr:TspO/MBR family protein [bacterium]